MIEIIQIRDELTNMLGIVILNYNTWDDTIACIESLLKFTKINKGKIYVVDNASPITPQNVNALLGCHDPALSC